MLLTNGLGDVLYESADIAFDTTRSMFFNPVTHTDYGPTAPAGGWPISWYKDATTGQAVAGSGASYVAQTPQQASVIQQQAQTFLNNQGATAANANTSTVNTTNATTTPVASGFNLFGVNVTPTMMLVGVGALAFIMMNRGR